MLIYGVILIALGYMGYQQGSQISLYSGVGFGSLLLISAWLMFSHYKVGSYMALIITILLTAIFAIRYSTTGKGLPAVLAVISGAMLLFLLAKTAKWKK